MTAILESLSDDWTATSIWEVRTDEDALNEAGASGVKNGSIIGVVRGTFFFPDGISENKRFYPKDLWTDVLGRDDIKRRLSERVMFGRIGHVDEPVNDEDLQNGKVSHIVTKLFIEGNEGKGEAYILDTPAGKNLLTYLRAGSAIKISSRASGNFLEGEQHKGMPIVSKKDYTLETFDFVLKPGFSKTNPQLVESQNEKPTMDSNNNELITRLMENRDNAHSQLSEALGKLNSISVELAEAKKKLAAMESGAENSEKVRVLGESVARKFGQDSLLGLVEHLNESDTTAMALAASYGLKESDLRNYLELGSTTEISEAVDASIAALEVYHKIGKPSEIQATLDMAEEALDKYLQLGSINEVAEKLQRLEELEDEADENYICQIAEEKSEKFGLDIALVEKLARTVDEEELDALLESLVAKEEVEKTGKEHLTEKHGLFRHATASGRLFESFNPTKK